ncbi:uncharacterized protein LOC117111446 isoform X2 [Anneissia japonica]|uniref:uncharacterized protein LOC117111446 isoform X2 n=1 Tax=Anneissia japonica TaxID=1529436 RepID=UPI00142582DB|nr:uncharacterized protein LOC117111446 isoform X2 [Anneissia japonica]
MLQSIGIICLALVLPGQGTPLFDSVSHGSFVIQEGHHIFLLCQLHGLTDAYSISWYRETISGERTVIYENGRLINNDLGKEAEAYSTSKTYDVNITQVRGRDLGHLLNGNNYTCEVSLKSTGKTVLVSSGLILTANYLPASVYPICEACDFSSDSIGSNVTITCFSQPGQPNIDLQWSRNGGRIGNLHTITKHSLIYLKYTFILEAQDLESIYSCTNILQRCNLTPDSDKACVDESSPKIFFDTVTSSPGTVIIPTNGTSSDSRTQTSNIPTVIGASIGAVLFFCFLTGVCLYRRHEKQRPTMTFHKKSTTEFTTEDNQIVYLYMHDVTHSNTKCLDDDITINPVES